MQPECYGSFMSKNSECNSCSQQKECFYKWKKENDKEPEVCRLEVNIEGCPTCG